MNGYDDGGDLPGGAGVTQAIERSWDQLHGPAPDKVDAALRALTEAQRVLKDSSLMAAVRRRLEEQREAVAKAGKKGAL